MNREERKSIAEQTLQILREGKYTVGSKTVSIADAHKHSVTYSVCIPDYTSIRELHLWFPEKCVTFHGTAVEALSEMHEKGLSKLGVLNFASAKSPGGGFLNGSMAQEESLAYSSGLYDTLMAHPDYYRRNTRIGAPYYIGYAIFSPEVVFFRDANFNLLEKPFTVSVVSLPAVNRNVECDAKTADFIMRKRMRRTLDIFIAQGLENIVLGDYGCGVFKNNRDDVRKWWEGLLDEGYGNRFRTIYYTII